MIRFFEGPVLGIETSCDETSAAVLEGDFVISNVIASQVDMHQKWGGIVPEAAARAHVEAILPVVAEALEGTIPDAIAVTNGPGLVGALSVGVTAAKALSLAWQVPYIGVHHLEGHILSVLARHGANSESPSTRLPFPHLCLIVSGGHTELVWVEEAGRYRILGQTLDDAAGEAFDKGARLLGLGYPGGRAVQELAKSGDPNRYSLPRALANDPFNFSFSGLKTATLRLVEKEGDRISVPDAAASLQAAIVSSLTTKTAHALESTGARALTLVGGVAANEALRRALHEECKRWNVTFFTPELQMCTDNAAMIALAGSIRLRRGETSDMRLDCYPNAPLPGLMD